MDFFDKLLPYLLSGISVGGQYALIAVGYTMVYGILRLINFAHGDVFMVAGLMMVYAVTWMPLWLAVPFVIVMTVVLGFVIERVAYKPLRSAPRMSEMCIRDRKLPLSRPRSHHSEQAMNRKLAMQLPVTEPRPPRTTMSSIS